MPTQSALSVRLVHRRGVDLRPGGARVREVRIDVINVTTRPLGASDERRRQSVLSRDAVQPDGGIPDANLTVDRLPVGGPVDTSGLETERRHQEVVRCRDVLVDEKWDDSARTSARSVLPSGE